jgi:predicted chitinase
MLSIEQLRSIMPGVSAKRGGTLLPFLEAALTEFTIDAPPRAAAFLAQIAHESGQFQFFEELWGPTAAQQRYEPPSPLATRLGNTEPGDGRRFKGRGPIQITGRANYRRYGALLGADLLSDPARAAGPDVGFRIAGLFWKENGLNELADLVTDEAFRTITKRINGGFNGLAERQKFYATARDVLDVAAPAVTRGAPRAAAARGTAEGPVFERGAEAIGATRSRAPRKAASKRKRKGRKTATRVSSRGRRRTSKSR